MEEDLSKKAWLDYLYYEIGKQRYDFKLCGLKLIKSDSEPDQIIFTKWKPYSEVCFNLNPEEDYKIEWVNNREILPNEIVLDIDDYSRTSCNMKLKEVVTKLKKLLFKNFYIYDTGSKGYHIHIFSISTITKEDKRFLIKYFGTDLLKMNGMIALEHCPHWKTGVIKKRGFDKNALL